MSRSPRGKRMSDKNAGLNDRPILLVEDNRDDLELTIMSLRKENIANEIVVARDGAEALEMIFGSGDDVL